MVLHNPFFLYIKNQKRKRSVLKKQTTTQLWEKTRKNVTYYHSTPDTKIVNYCILIKYIWYKTTNIHQNVLEITLQILKSKSTLVITHSWMAKLNSLSWPSYLWRQSRPLVYDECTTSHIKSTQMESHTPSSHEIIICS